MFPNVHVLRWSWLYKVNGDSGIDNTLILQLYSRYYLQRGLGRYTLIYTLILQLTEILFTERYLSFWKSSRGHAVKVGLITEQTFYMTAMAVPVLGKCPRSSRGRLTR